jgi:hypothetical protein
VRVQAALLGQHGAGRRDVVGQRLDQRVPEVSFTSARMILTWSALGGRV